MNPFARLPAFCSHLRIDSKEQGLVPLKLNGCQRYLIQEMRKAYDQDVRKILVLKGRQQGISTISLAIDLYWCFGHPGTQGSVVTDSEGNRDDFRSKLMLYMDALPDEVKIPARIHNRNHLVLENRSVLSYLVAGSRKGGSLGRGKAINFMHATEVSSWTDEEGLRSLMSTLAATHKDRLYIFESTARGFNLFYDLWLDAKHATTQAAIFVPWWLMESYRAYGKVYDVYWDGKIDPEEREWISEVKRQYGYSITPRQLAWWRWKLNEEMGSEIMMMQEYAPTEQRAFVLTGSQFFRAGQITDAHMVTQLLPYECLRYAFGIEQHHIECVPTNETNAELKIWDHPQPGATYVVGADPAYGSSEWADAFCIQVFRCYADKLEQVAEYCTPHMNTAQFAWVLMHICGYYKAAMYNLEISGPGYAVYNEIQNMQRHALSYTSSNNDAIGNVLGNIQAYLWRRPDSFGSGFVMHFKTNMDNKRMMMNMYRDAFETARLLVKSTELIEEMRYIAQQGDSIQGEGRHKDDRVIAAALANMAYEQWVRPPLVQNHYTYAENHAPPPEGRETSVLQNTLAQWLDMRIRA